MIKPYSDHKIKTEVNLTMFFICTEELYLTVAYLLKIRSIKILNSINLSFSTKNNKSYVILFFFKSFFS